MKVSQQLKLILIHALNWSLYFHTEKNEYETIPNLLQLEYRDSQNKVPQNRIKRT
jgi:hypothetical protein